MVAMTPSSELPAGTEAFATPVGEARVWWHLAAGRQRALVVLGHGAGRGVDTADLLALAGRLPGMGVGVVLVDQPWVVAGRSVAPAPATLDQAFQAVVPLVRERLPEDVPLVVGGRSAGARVACRTAGALGAAGVVALAFPLHPPGRPERTRVAELAGAGVPALVLQGERDAFGGPGELRDALLAAGRTAAASVEVLDVPWADHSLRVPARAPVTAEATLDALVAQVERWLVAVVGA
jgi:predicted alpha/beta-hydrolase family hydrolase